jgi:hypothetical protein
LGSDFVVDVSRLTLECRARPMNILQVSLAILARCITAAYGVKCDGDRRVEESDGLGKAPFGLACR